MLNDDLLTYLYHFCSWKDMHRLSLVNHRWFSLGAHGRSYVTRTWLSTATDEERKQILQHRPLPRTLLIRHVWWHSCLHRLGIDCRLTEADKSIYWSQLSAWRRYGVVPKERAWFRHITQDVLYAPLPAMPVRPCLRELLRFPHVRLRWKSFWFDGQVLKDERNRVYGALHATGFFPTAVFSAAHSALLDALEENPLRAITDCPFCGEVQRHRDSECVYLLADLGSYFQQLRTFGCRRWEMQRRRHLMHINRPPDLKIKC